jgi:hypothetical protein
LWIEGGEIEQIPDILNRFHASISDDLFAEMQKDNRLLWEKYLGPLGFYQQLLGKLARR